jgi:hypothetical protein
VSAVVVLWSFHGSAASEHVEQQVARIAGALLSEACVAAASVIVLLVLGYGEPKPTLLGIAILVAAATIISPNG